MKIFKSHFWYNQRQRNGILFLLIIIVILQLVYYFVTPQFKPLESNSDLDTYQKKLDSLKSLKSNIIKDSIYPFNPNYITDYKGYILGLSPDEIDRIFDYRKNGKFINTLSDFQQITKINDSVLNHLKPYLKFPEWINSKTVNQSKNIRHNSYQFSTNDLNRATVNDFKQIKGVGDQLSQRIVSYRQLINGFYFPDQLYEVYYLDSLTANEILRHFKIIEPPAIEKININDASFKQILKIPYIDYELTKKIFNYRKEVISIDHLEELKKIDSFPIDKYDRIALYLTSE